MEFKIIHNLKFLNFRIKKYFCIKLYNKHIQYTHDYIRSNLNIPSHIYYGILSDSGGELWEEHKCKEYFFNNIEDAQKAINKIESYLVLEKLTKKD